jgi:hypothetical protein
MMDEEISLEQLEKLKKDAGIANIPTQTTYHLRMGASGQGPRAYDWTDKPHRLLYDACAEIEEQDQTIIALTERIAVFESFAQYAFECSEEDHIINKAFETLAQSEKPND